MSIFANASQNDKKIIVWQKYSNKVKWVFGNNGIPTYDLAYIHRIQISAQNFSSQM